LTAKEKEVESIRTKLTAEANRSFVGNEMMKGIFMELFSHPHKRFNILTGEWVLVSPQRTKRPWKGKTEKADFEKKPKYDPVCYLCPGNKRANGDQNPGYTSTFVFENDYPALYEATPLDSINTGDLIIAESEKGICRVICYSPDHDTYIARMSMPEIEGVVRIWQDEYKTIGNSKHINYVQIFENRGARMGASSPHPHCQVWANESIPVVPAMETQRQKAHKTETGSCLLCDYIALELKLKERIVLENEEFAALVPFWAVWPYETMILPKRHMSSILDLNASEVSGLSDIMKKLSVRYDNLFESEFPFSMGIHQKPTDGNAHDEWHFHLHYYPPLLRSASIAKFMVGYELLAMPQRDITAEGAAQALRNLSDTHYTDTTGEKR
jgi:UDPglucose--hexose-1-phosphate uridylyltransferase